MGVSCVVSRISMLEWEGADAVEDEVAEDDDEDEEEDP